MTTITYRHGHKQGPSLAWTSPTGLDRLGWKRKQRATVLSSPPKPVELEISTPQAILNINKLKKNSRQSESGHQIWAPFRTEHNSHGSEQ